MIGVTFARSPTPATPTPTPTPTPSVAPTVSPSPTTSALPSQSAVPTSTSTTVPTDDGWAHWDWVGWNALSSISTLVIVLFTAVTLVVSIRSARQANEAAAAATKQANDASAAAIKQANEATAAAIRDANTRAERDQYRDLLIKIAELLPFTVDIQGAVIGGTNSSTARILISVLPVTEFPLPITRYVVDADNAPHPAPESVADPVGRLDARALITREIAAAMAQLHGRQYVLNRNAFAGSAEVGGSAYGPVASGGGTTFHGDAG